MHVAGGEHGTAVTEGYASSDVRLAISGEDLLSLMTGRLRPLDAMQDGRLAAEGDLSALELFPELFDAGANEGATHVKG
jgi:putative sterol carrier protein